MDSGYEIIDNRLPETLRKSTFSGYKKTDVYNILFLSIENGKIENACTVSYTHLTLPTTPYV